MDTSLEQKKAAYLTHELRAPLTSIICALEVMKERAEAAVKEQSNEEDKAMLSVALRNAERLNRLIDDILDLCKIQNGIMKLVAVPCDCVAVAMETVEDMMPWAKHKGLKLTLKAEEACPAVFIDPRRTGQILTNLISNAIKFTPSGGSIEVAIEAGRREHAGFVIVSVRDTGIGISPQDKAQIFRYFVQAGPPESRKDGSGLGLALARSMTQIQGGEMWAESRLGAGSTFFFTLPIQINASDSADVPSLKAKR